MTFDIPTQSMKCERCDRTQSIEEADRREARQAEHSFSVDLLTCPTCGAEIRAMNTAAAAFCSYCGSSVMLEKQEDLLDPPEQIVPFQVTREQCFEKYRSMLKRSLCADHRLKKDVKPESFRGIYVPYYTYRGDIVGGAKLKGTQTKGDTTYYYDTVVNLNHHFEGILHDASREMPDYLSEKISRVDRKAFRPFSPAYLSGYYADVPDTHEEAYIPYAKAEVVRNGLSDVIGALEDGCHYDTQDAQKSLLKVADASYTGQTMLPVWFMSMRSGNRVLYAVQNAVTGEMWADMPLDISRFALVTAGLAVVLSFLFNSFLALRPEMVMVAAMLLAVFAQLAVNGREREISDRERTSNEIANDKKGLKEQVRRMKRLQRRVNRQASGNISNYLIALASGIGSVLILRYMSGMEDYRIYKYSALALTVVMAGLVIWQAFRKTRLPIGSYAALGAMVAGIIILLTDPFRSADLPVYIITGAIMAAVLWESAGLLKLYNKACSNPLPQFESHTGGEDRA